MPILAGVLVLGVVVAIAVWIVAREATRMTRQPPPVLFSLDDAYDWVVVHLPDPVAATLTREDVRRILAFQVEYFTLMGVSVNGSTVRGVTGPVVVGGPDTVDYILERAAATGEAYLPEQVHAVLDTQLAYLRAIGALSTPADPEPPAT